MPYNKNKELPSYVKKLSSKLQEGWKSVFNAAYDKYGEERATMIANAWVKKQAEPKKLVKRSVVSFELDSSSGFIKRSRDGEEYVTFVLNSTQPHRDGKLFSEKMLRNWAETINNNPTMIGGGDADHVLYDQLVDSNVSDDTVRSVLKSKKGIARMVQATFKDGKLWVRAVLDKRYKRIVEKSRGVSAEALCSWDGNVATDGELLGFSFNVNTTPADYAAGVVNGLA